MPEIFDVTRDGVDSVVWSVKEADKAGNEIIRKIKFVKRDVRYESKWTCKEKDFEKIVDLMRWWR